MSRSLGAAGAKYEARCPRTASRTWARGSADWVGWVDRVRVSRRVSPVVRILFRRFFDRREVGERSGRRDDVDEGVPGAEGVIQTCLRIVVHEWRDRDEGRFGTSALQAVRSRLESVTDRPLADYVCVEGEEERPAGNHEPGEVRVQCATDRRAATRPLRLYALPDAGQDRGDHRNALPGRCGHDRQGAGRPLGDDHRNAGVVEPLGGHPPGRRVDSQREVRVGQARGLRTDELPRLPVFRRRGGIEADLRRGGGSVDVGEGESDAAPVAVDSPIVVIPCRAPQRLHCPAVEPRRVCVLVQPPGDRLSEALPGLRTRK
jgi:hypothetical protein